MKYLFNHPAWQNRYGRYAIVLLLIAFLIVLVDTFAKTFLSIIVPFISAIGILFVIIAFVLMILALMTAGK
jgi:hypothetical protein